LQTIIGVRFKKAGKIYYFSPGRLEIAQGDDVIVETARGIEYGHTVIGPKEVEDSAVNPPLKVVKRKATEADKDRVRENKEKEQEAFGICNRKIAEHQLPMKLVNVEYTFDVNKIIFYFTADGRIDFRDLVKDLASVFRMRIELRQIGVRDEAKFMGGIGGCGRPLCCASFLGDFEPVSIRMAKDQNLSLNPAKISGICGRLMCCLKYENECYEENCHKRVAVQEPKQGSRVVSVEGEGRVISVNSQRRTATLLMDDGKTVVASWEDVIEKDEGDGSETDGKRQGERSSERHGDGESHHRSRRDRSNRSERSSSKGKREKGHKDSKESREPKEHRERRPRHEEKREGKEAHERDGRSRNRRDRRGRKPKEGNRSQGNDGADAGKGKNGE